MRSARLATNHIVGNWHGPYERGPSSANPSNLFCSASVCSRVNAAPKRRSISERAKTASDCLLSGGTRLASA